MLLTPKLLNSLCERSMDRRSCPVKIVPVREKIDYHQPKCPVKFCLKITNVKLKMLQFELKLPILPSYHKTFIETFLITLLFFYHEAAILTQALRWENVSYHIPFGLLLIVSGKNSKLLEFQSAWNSCYILITNDCMLEQVTTAEDCWRNKFLSCSVWILWMTLT